MPHVDPWDRKVDDERLADTLRTFIIFCEDDNSEPLYFRSFSNDKIKVNAIPNQKQGIQNLLNAIEKCKADGLMVFTDRGYQVVEGIRERIWSVYDRDLENANWDQVDEQDHLNFDIATQTAMQTGLNVAWSNDAFELWVLLHFEDVATGTILHRNVIYERLTEIFRTIEPRTPELEAITCHPRFSYKQSFKRREYFLPYRLPKLKQNVTVAIKQG
jgi:hypothetical protein